MIYLMTFYHILGADTTPNLSNLFIETMRVFAFTCCIHWCLIYIGCISTPFGVLHSNKKTESTFFHCCQEKSICHHSTVFPAVPFLQHYIQTFPEVTMSLSSIFEDSSQQLSGMLAVVNSTIIVFYSRNSEYNKDFISCANHFHIYQDAAGDVVDAPNKTHLNLRCEIFLPPILPLSPWSREIFLPPILPLSPWSREIFLPPILPLSTWSSQIFLPHILPLSPWSREIFLPPILPLSPWSREIL